MKPAGSRRNFLKTMGLGISALGLTSCKTLARAAGSKPPNIVFIYSDDHAYQAISAYQSRLADIAPTPNLDRLAGEGMRFDRCHVTNSLCGPCRAVILTGKHSHLNGFMRNQREPFDGTQQTFPKLLQKAGYQTAIVGKWHLKSKPTGFDFWEVLPGQGQYYNPDFITMDGRKRDTGYVTDLITDKAIKWLDDQRDASKPFMLMVQHKAPHRAWEPPLRHLNLFDDVTIPEPPSLFDNYEGRGTAARDQEMTIDRHMNMNRDLKVWGSEKDAKGKQRAYGRMNDAQRKAWDAAYDPKNEAFKKANLSGRALVRWKYQRYMKDYLRCITAIDDNVGRVLDYLDENKLDRDTVVIYSSDQGFYLGEHGWFDKRFMYKESFRTPFLVRWPGKVKPGTVNRDLVQNLDFAETFLDITGVPVPPDMQGVSLRPLLEGRKPADWRKSLYYHYYEFPGAHHVHPHEGVVTDRYKLIHFYTLKEWEFYDLARDPHEMASDYENPEYAGVVADMKKELARLRGQYKLPALPDSAGRKSS